MSNIGSLAVRRPAALALTWLLAVGGGSALAQNGGSADPAKLLEQLKTLEETVTKARTGNNLAALDAIAEAASADAKAVALWMDSVRETEFRDKDKKEAEFRAWRDGAGRRLSEPGAASALRLHLQYLLLTIRVATATTDQERADILTSLLGYLDELSKADKDTLKNRVALDTAVLSTPIAVRYKLDITVKPPDAWSLVPGDLEAIYESAILPYLREKKDVARLQTAWSRRLQQEASQVATQDSEFVTKHYREVVLPALEWTQARDLYVAGSTGAAAKMLQLIQQHQAHKNTPQWIKELRSLLNGGPPIIPAVTARTPAGPGSATQPPEPPEAEPPATPSVRPRTTPPTFPPNINR